MTEEIIKEAQKLAKKPMTQISVIVMEIIADNIIKGKEIKRLNNIINELEKYIIEMSNRSWDDNGAYEDVLDKLKELKEDE